MVSLSSLATLALDYRRAHGDQSEAAEEVHTPPLIVYLKNELFSEQNEISDF
jgi:hypothetical protein